MMMKEMEKKMTKEDEGGKEQRKEAGTFIEFSLLEMKGKFLSSYEYS